MISINSHHKLILIGASVTYLALSVPPIANAAIYKWVDSEGKTHYSDERPKNEKLEIKKIQVRTKKRQDIDEGSQEAVKATVQDGVTGEESSQTTAQLKDSAVELRQKQANINEAKQQRCTQARTELAILNKNIPVYLDENEQYRLNWAGDTYTGARSYLTNEEKKAAQQKAKEALTEHCSNPNDENAQAQARRKWARSEYCLLNQAILKDLQRPDIKASENQRNKQQALTDKYCNDNAITLSTDATEPEIFPRQGQ